MNIIILSDHGMSNSVAPPTLVQNFANLSLIDTKKSIFNYVSNIFPSPGTNLNDLYTSLSKLPNTSVYLKQNVPGQYHYSNNDRIGSVVAVSDEGYYLTTDPTYPGIIFISFKIFNRTKLNYLIGFKGMAGIHGYNNSLPTMRAVFMG
jgi:hypothetical protein